MDTPTLSRHSLKMIALGALSFWLPDTLLHWIRGSGFGEHGDVLILTVLMPLTLLVTYVTVLNTTLAGEQPGKPGGGPMMLGVWLLCGFFVNAGEFGRSLPYHVADYIGVFISSLYPRDVLGGLFYDGGLPALVIVTISAPIVWAIRVWTRPNPA